jgi:hypothetical protein
VVVLVWHGAERLGTALGNAKAAWDIQHRRNLPYLSICRYQGKTKKATGYTSRFDLPIQAFANMLVADKLRLLVGVCIVTTVAADTGDDFSNNLFTDLAPYVSSICSAQSVC